VSSVNFGPAPPPDGGRVVAVFTATQATTLVAEPDGGFTEVMPLMAPSYPAIVEAAVWSAGQTSATASVGVTAGSSNDVGGMIFGFQ
jgi:hypothetical protein